MGKKKNIDLDKATDGEYESTSTIDDVEVPTVSEKAKEQPVAAPAANDKPTPKKKKPVDRMAYRRINVTNTRITF